MSDEQKPVEPIKPVKPIESGRRFTSLNLSTEVTGQSEPSGIASAVLGFPLRAWDILVLVLLVITADICLYTNPGGTGGAVLLLVAALGLIASAPGGWSNAHRTLFASLVLIALMCAWNCQFLLGFVGVLSVAAFAIKSRRPEWSITEATWSMPWTAVLAPFRLLGYALRLLGYGADESQETTRRTPLRVVVIPLLVVLLFVLIFSAANPVVEKIANKFFDLFTFARVMSWFGWSLVFAALLRPHVRSWFAQWLVKRRESLEAPVESNSGDFATALSTLVCVNVLFLAFNALDSVYLYFKAELPEGITFSEYSHRGCTWLTFALIVSAGIIGLIFRHRLNFHARNRMLRVWAYVWAAQNVILAIGALRRLQMYVDYNGMTRLRIVGIYGILLVVVGLVLMIMKVQRAKNFVWLVRRDLIAFWVVMVLLALTPLDIIVWRYNVSQAMSGNLRPLANLTVQHMSPEAYPELIPLLDHPTDWVRSGAAGLLGIETDKLREMTPEHWTDWQGSWEWAFTRLSAQQDRITAIAVRHKWLEARQALFDKVSPWVHYDRSSSWRVRD